MTLDAPALFLDPFFLSPAPSPDAALCISLLDLAPNQALALAPVLSLVTTGSGCGSGYRPGPGLGPGSHAVRAASFIAPSAYVTARRVLLLFDNLSNHNRSVDANPPLTAVGVTSPPTAIGPTSTPQPTSASAPAPAPLSPRKDRDP